MPNKRASIAPPPNSNLYCTNCDVQIGVCENEWSQLTSQYARPSRKGMAFGLTTGDELQVVPNQKAAEGCMMASVSCNACSSMVGQYCDSAPDSTKSHFVDHIYYKLSRIYLKDARSMETLQPLFLDQEPTEREQSRGIRSSVPAKRNAPSEYSLVRPSSRRESLPARPQNSFTSQMSSRPNRMSSPDLFQRPSLPTKRAQPDQDIDGSSITFITQELFGHGAAISDCLRQLTDFENRAAVTDERLQKMECIPESASKTTVDNLMERVSTQSAALEQQHGHIESQRVKLEEQQLKIDTVTQKCEELQKTLDGLKSAMEEKERTRVLQQAPRPDTRDFLENLEVMVTAMRDARNSDSEVKALRNENRAMKAQLESIASAMGASATLSRPATPDATNEQNVLGKRKRETGKDHVPRKAKFQGSDMPRRLRDETGLPTPDSIDDEGLPTTIPGNDSLHDSNSEDGQNQEVTETHDFSFGSPQDEGSPALDEQIQSTEKQNDTVCVPSEIVDTPGLQTAQLAYLPHEGFGQSMQLGGFYNGFPLPAFGTFTGSYNPQFRPSFTSRAPTPYLTGTTGHGPYAPSLVFPLPQKSVTPFGSSVQTSAVVRSSGRSGSGPFSDALSRGQRLEEIIPKSTRPNSGLPHSQDALVSSKPSGEIVNAIPIDFSDEEDEVSADIETQPNKSTMEAANAISDGTLVSRTIPGLTLEPLKRPIIHPEPRFRRSTGSQAPTVMPEFMTAIQNLNRSAARHAATPAPAMPSQEALPAPLEKPVSNVVRKGARTSEPLLHGQVGSVRTEPIQPLKRQTGPLKETNANIVPRLHDSTNEATAGKPKQKVGDVQTNRNVSVKVSRVSVSQARRTSRLTATPMSEQENEDACSICKRRGTLLCCDGCPKSYHGRCLKPALTEEPEGDWFCPTCSDRNRTVLKSKSKKRISILKERDRLAEEAMAREEPI